MKTKITKTLLDSWLYTFDCGEDAYDEAMERFLATLRREQMPPTEAMQNGTRFEQLVQEIAEGRFAPTFESAGTVNPVSGEVMGYDKYPANYQGAKKIAEIVQGGVFQVPVSGDITVAGHDFWMYGICDVVKAGMIYDIKFKNKSFGSLELAGSYMHKPQHSIYLHCLPEAMKFQYLVSDGTDLYTEEYTRETMVPVTEYLQNFLAWIYTQPELKRIYEERWAV